MHTRIYRYELTSETPSISVPQGAIIIDAMPCKHHLNLYMLADLRSPRETRYFRFFRTGEELPDFIWDCVHVKTLPGGAHFFEVPAHLIQPA